jgi:outer membrane protein TolC
MLTAQIASLSHPSYGGTSSPEGGLAYLSPDQSTVPAQSVQSARPSSHHPFDGPTSLEALLDYALANNPEIQAARFQARALAARVPQAKSLPDPQLVTMVFLEEVQTAAGPQEVALSLSQKFPWFGKRALRSQVAYYDWMAAYSRVASTELEVVERVKRAYFELSFLQAAVRENRRLEKALEQVIAVATTKYETSAETTGLESVYQAQIELSKLKIDLIRLEEAQRQAQARLAGVLHLPVGTEMEALDSTQRSRLEQTVENLVGLAASFQPEFEAFRREVARDQSAVHLARRDYWPDVTMSFNWHEMGDGGISPVSNGRDAFSIGVGVNLPIYRQRLNAAVREARHQVSATQRHFRAVRDRFQTEIQTLYAEFREHHRTLEVLETEIVPRAEETLTLTMEAYRTDRASFQQLMDVYRTLLRYRIELHRRVALREQAVASLERAVGCAVTSADGDAVSQGPASVGEPAPEP